MLILSNQLFSWGVKTASHLQDVKIQDYETEATSLHKWLLLDMFILYLKC